MAEISGKKFERQSIVAAQCGEKVLAPFGYHGTCDAKLFNFWLAELVTRNYSIFGWKKCWFHA